jgi:uncharacterized cupredoxin-like copper-binding protein
MTYRSTLTGMVALGALVLGSCGDDAADTPAKEALSRAGSDADLEVIATDDARFEPDALTMPAGEEVTLALSAQNGPEHDFVVEDAADVGRVVGDDTHPNDGQAAGDLHIAHADPGETAEATFQIDSSGTYTVFCSIPGHREGGMVATLTVEGDLTQGEST